MFDTKQMSEMAEKFSELYTKTGMKPEAFADAFKAMMPETPKVTFNKNGYEIRTKVLELAKDQVWQDFQAKMGEYEASVKKEDDEVITTVNYPTVPGADSVLEAAEKFYNFVNGNKK